LFIAAINDSDAARLLSAAQIANRVRPSQAAKTLVWEKILRFAFVEPSPLCI
jgi:hypothetical protein